jgi:hypothetical protein
VSPLIGFDAIVPTFYCRIRPATTMVIDDFILPITHGLQRSLNGIMIYVFALLKPSYQHENTSFHSQTWRSSGEKASNASN